MKFIEMQPFARFVRQLKLDMETCFPTYVPLDARLFYVLSGEGQICIDNRAVSIPAGSVLFVSAGYAYRLLPCNAEYLAALIRYGKAIENKFEYGIAGGLGIEYKTKIGNFIVEGRYYYGLSDIFGNSKTDDFGRSANTTITVRIGYSIRIF